MGTAQKKSNKIVQSMQQSVTWLLDAAKRIFSPKDDDYPATGVQPFDGDFPEADQQ